MTGIPIEELGKTRVLLGKTHQPLGEMTTLTGIVIEGPSKGHDDGPNVRVQLINGQATQEVIDLQLVAYLSSFNVQNLGDPPRPPYSLDDLSLKVPDQRPTEEAGQVIHYRREIVAGDGCAAITRAGPAHGMRAGE